MQYVPVVDPLMEMLPWELAKCVYGGEGAPENAVPEYNGQLLLLLIDLYSAMSRMEHESERCDGAEPS